MGYKILDSVWYTTALGNLIGIVAIASGPDDKNWKAYIGVAVGVDQKDDEQTIAGYGAKLLPAPVAQAQFPNLPPEGFVI